MGRPHRTQFPGATYRIRLTGNNRGRIFKDDGDRERFLSLLERAGRHFSLKIHAFCLGGRDAELVLETPLGNLSKAMQAFETAYTKAFNSRYGRHGHVFQGRYASELLQGSPTEDDLRCELHAANGHGAQLKRLLPSLASRTSPLSDPSTASRRADPTPPAIDPLLILAEVSREAGVPAESILAVSRDRKVSRARREAVYRAYQAGLTVSALGKVFRRTPGGIVQMIKKREAAA